MTAAQGEQCQSSWAWKSLCWKMRRFVCVCVCVWRCVRVLSWSTWHGEVWWMRKLWLRPWKKAGYEELLWTFTSRSLSGDYHTFTHLFSLIYWYWYRFIDILKLFLTEENESHGFLSFSFALEQFFPRSSKRCSQPDLHTTHRLVQRAGITGDEGGRRHGNTQSHHWYGDASDCKHFTHFCFPVPWCLIPFRRRPYSRQPSKLCQQRVLRYRRALGDDGAAAASGSPWDQWRRLQVGGRTQKATLSHTQITCVNACCQWILMNVGGKLKMNVYHSPDFL